MTSEILIIGVLISIIFYEVTSISPGGIIVPGLMVLYISSPLRMIATLVIALLSYFTVKLLSKKFLIYGKRRFTLLILLSFVYYVVINLIASLFVGNFSLNIISIVGYTTAGIIASNMYKTGVIKTTLSLGICVLILEACVLVLRGI